MSGTSSKRELLKSFIPSRLRSQSPAANESKHDDSATRPGATRSTSSQNASGKNLKDPTAMSIWDEAWSNIQSEEPKLVEKYQQYLVRAGGSSGASATFIQLSGKERQDALLRTAEAKVEAVNAKLKDGSLGSRLQGLVKGAVEIIIKGKDFVSSAVSSEPHAALAWAGFCVLLPLLLNPSTEQDAALTGLADVARILCRYNVIENDVFGSRSWSGSDLVKLKEQLRKYLVQLYAKIIKLQIQLVKRYDRVAVLQYFRDVLQVDDWQSLVKSIKDLEESNFKDVSTIGQHALFHIQGAIEKQGLQVSAGFAEMTKNLQQLESNIVNLRIEGTKRQDSLEDSNVAKAFESAVNLVLQKNRNSECAPDTGQWFFHHPQYEAFQQASGSQLLFVTAEAGGGKSTVMRTLVDRLQESNDEPLVAYYFFKDDDERLRSYDEALSALIHQLLVQDRRLLKHVKEPQQRFGDAVKHRSEEMWKALSKMGADTYHDIVCVLDAIDECGTADRRQLVADLKTFFGELVNSNARLKFVVSSRGYQDEAHPYEDLVAGSHNTRHLDGENARVQADIQKVIRYKAEKLALKRGLDDAIRDMLVEKISAQNLQTRSFLAVHMAFELLDSHNRMHKGAGERTINIILADIPNSLGEQFDQMLERSLDREHTRRLFCIILAARRTLKIEEFKVIYSLTQPIGHDIAAASSYDELELPPDDEEFKQLVRSRCGLFVTFVKNSVHLFHQTAREHLMGRIDSRQPAPLRSRTLSAVQHETALGASSRPSWKGSISTPDANLECAVTCLDILSFTVPQDWLTQAFDDLEAGNDIHHAVRSFTRSRPLFTYSAFNWYEHVVDAGDLASNASFWDRYSSSLDISKTQFWGWFLTVADHVLSNRGGRANDPISSVWMKKDNGDIRFYEDYSSFLRKICLREMYPMDDKVLALFRDESIVHSISLPTWKAADGFGLVDRFHFAYGEYEFTSVSRAVQALEVRDEKTATILQAGTPISTLIWTSLINHAPIALKKALSLAKDTSWIQAIPDHIVYRRRKWIGGSTRSGESLRKERRKGWRKAHPATFVTFLEANKMTSGDSLFEVLADWVDKSSLPLDFAQQMWEAGSFVNPLLCRRLVNAGASINCELWQDRRTALQVAAACWEHDTIRTLLELGADPGKCSENGYNALHWFFAAEKPFSQETGYEVNHSKTFRHWYRKSSIASSVKSLVSTGVVKDTVLNGTCRKERTPLMMAVQCSPTAVKALLAEGADLNKRDKRGRSPAMHFFLSSNFYSLSNSILKDLLHAGADVRALDRAGKSLLGYWATRMSAESLSHLYAGYNAHNRAFHALANVGPFSEINFLAEEIKSLHVPLVVASRLGNTQLCLALLRAGANPNAHGIDVREPLAHNNGSEASDLEDLRWNPLMVALWSRAYVTAMILLAHGADINFELPKRRRTKYNKYRVKKAGLTPLHLAVVSKKNAWYSLGVTLKTGGRSEGCAFRAVAHPEVQVAQTSVWERLRALEHDRRRNLDKGERSSDSEYEVAESALVNDSRGVRLTPYDVLPDNVGQMNASCDPLLDIIYNKGSTLAQRQEALVECMLSRGALINACTAENITPLMACVEEGNVNLVKIFLQRGADPNIASVQGCTPLMRAADNGHAEIVKLLLDAGADTCARQTVPEPKNCRCAKFVSWGNWNHDACDAPLNALTVAAERGNYAIVENLLEHGADPNSKIVHHVHGKLLSKRDMERQGRDMMYESASESDSETEVEPEQWKGYITVATALTWARNDVRRLLIRHGADASKEEATKECKCHVERKKLETHGINSSDDDNYPTDSETDSNSELSPRQRRMYHVSRSLPSDSSDDEDEQNL